MDGNPNLQQRYLSADGRRFTQMVYQLPCILYIDVENWLYIASLIKNFRLKSRKRTVGSQLNSLGLESQG